MSKSALVALALVLLSAPSAFSQETLTGGRRALFVNKSGDSRDLGKITIAKDAALSLENTLCPATVTLQLSSSTWAGPQITLPCEPWEIRGSGMQYRDKYGVTGGVTLVKYSEGKLKIKLSGAAFEVPEGPVNHIEMRFGVGGTLFCGRFEVLRKNDSTKILASRPSVACNVACGDGVVDPGETCDDGNFIEDDGCDMNCTLTSCGNGIMTTGEDCDDGNNADGDGCRNDCTIEACGDGILDPQDACDDGNNTDGDCCSSTCTEEDGGSCSDLDNCTTDDICVGSVCTGLPIKPWINEFDYDDFALGGNIDRDEFVEIGAPTGTDLSGYRVLAVEGNSTCGFTVFVGVGTGQANFSATIPPGSIVTDDNGRGVGLFVVCFTSTSGRHVNAGSCDVVLPAPSVDTNLQNGDLVNASPFNCPDGILLLTPNNDLADAVSYEGIVPAVGNYGPYFHLNTPYSVGVDKGFKTGVSFEKTTDVGPAASAAEWQLSGQCLTADQIDPTCIPLSDTPGEENPEQQLSCPEQYCGNGSVTFGEDCDEGLNNSDAPDATCRTDCGAQRCGDGIVDPGFGEVCETTADCLSGYTCVLCECLDGVPLGVLAFTPIPGPSVTAPADDGEFSWLNITQLVPGIANGTQGDFTPGPILLEGGLPDANGVAPLVLKQPAYIGATAPALGGGGTVCFRFAQDPLATGYIDCDGGSSAKVFVSVDSHGAGANDAATPVIGGGPDDGAGAAVVRIVTTGALVATNGADCSLVDYSLSTPVRTALTTGPAQSLIWNPRQTGVSTSVSLSGLPFDCGNWTSDSGASIVMPSVNMDVAIPFLGTSDIAQALRLNDD